MAALLAAGALALAGCGMLEGADPEPTSNGPADEDADGSDDQHGAQVPEGFDDDLPRFGPGDVDEGAASR